MTRLLTLRIRDSNDPPVLVLFDVRAAFPSVFRDHLFRAARAASFPPHLVRVIEALYADNDLLLPAAEPALLCKASRGVAQGCPLSAVLYLLAMDAWLHAPLSSLRAGSAGVARLCADDLGVLLRRCTRA